MSPLEVLIQLFATLLSTLICLGIGIGLPLLAVVGLITVLRRESWTPQNQSERDVMRLVNANFKPPNFHLLNSVTLPLDDGTTQIDHILIGRTGLFVIETKRYQGWIFGSAESPQWTQVLFRKKFRFRNPVLQNKRHLKAVRRLLPELTKECFSSIVVFMDCAEFKTELPDSVCLYSQLVETIKSFQRPVLTADQIHLAIGRIESSRQAVTQKTDIEHQLFVRRKYGVRD